MIRVVDATLLRVPAGYRHPEGVVGEPRRHPVRHRPADDHPGPYVHHHGQVEPALVRADVGDVREPGPVRAVGRELAAHQVGGGVGLRRGRLRLALRPLGAAARRPDPAVLAHDARHALARRGLAGLLELGEDLRRPVDAAAGGVYLRDLPGELGVPLVVRARPGLATLGWTVSRGPAEGGSDGRSKAPEAFRRRVQEADCVALQRREAAKRDHARVRSREHDAAKVDQLHQRHRLAARRRQQDARAEQDHRVGAREQEAPHGGRRPKTSGAASSRAAGGYPAS